MKIILEMDVEVNPNKGYTIPIVIEAFIRNGVVGLTHEAYTDDDSKAGEIDINEVSWEVEDDSLSKMQERQSSDD